MKILKEFKEFAYKGNILDLAVGVVLGTAFGKIVSSLVADLIMPALGLLIDDVNFKDIKIILKDAVIQNNVIVKEALSLNIGNFIQAIFDFLIIAFAIFFTLRTIKLMKKKEEAKTQVPSPPSKQEKLLEEIRDILKSK